MRILIADKVPEWLPIRLREIGCTVEVDPKLDKETLTAAIARFEPVAVLVRSTKVQAEQLNASASLKMVLRAGAGVNTIDVAEATRLHIYVTNCPGTNSAAVAELAIGLLISLDRRIPDNVGDLRRGAWAKNEYSKAAGLRGRTLGLLGLGNIGMRVARIARAMDMNVVFYDPWVPADKADGMKKLETPLEVAAASDAISLHLAEVPATANIAGADFFAAMKPGALFINTSRAGLVDREALVKAIAEKGIRAGLDVFWQEPAAADTAFVDPIAEVPGVYGTHHIGASTQQAQDAVSEVAFDVLAAWIKDTVALNAVNSF